MSRSRRLHLLESLLRDAFKGKGFQKINVIIQEKDKCVRQKFTWFERTREFLSLIEPKENKHLVNLVEDFFNTVLALRTLNTLLTNVTREEKKAFATSEEMCLLMKEFVKTVQDVGDYDIQVALVEVLFRLMLKKCRDDMVHSWFEDQYVTEVFREIKDGDFETLKKPADDKLEEFWIDFNYGSESITFYSDSLEDILWESIRLSKEDISSYYLQEKEGEKILIIIMRRSIVINKAEITKIRIHFDSWFDVLTPLLKTIGKDKMIILDEEENANQGKTATVSIQLERKEDLIEIDSLSDILTSHRSNESVSPVVIDDILEKKKGARGSSKQRMEANNSESMSEKSWIHNPQNNTLPKVADYTRKKTKVKSKLKVLPLSSPSSGNDYDTTKYVHSPCTMLEFR
ncbi:Synaptonemal complex protein 2-like protein, partial [Ophiophagus hannah]